MGDSRKKEKDEGSRGVGHPWKQCGNVGAIKK